MANSVESIYGLNYATFFTLIDNMYDEVLVYDNNYNIVYINQACSRHYSSTQEDMIGKTFFDFVDEHWWAPSILPIVYKEKKAYAIKQRTLTNCELYTIAVPFFDKNRDIAYVVMNVRDNVQSVDLYNPQYVPGQNKDDSVPEPVAESREMKEVLQFINRIAGVDTTCLLTGESGTGKTLLARHMHLAGPRKDRPFISLNCACIPNELIESELFGYEKGAFSGARAGGKKGILQAADSGTVLLDEISELSLAAQAKLLNVIQDKEFLPIGSVEAVKVDVKIIAATNKNLRNMVEVGTFREDLYYRINVVELYIPPLRKRRCDIPHLVRVFIDRFNRKYGMNKSFSDEAVKVLCSSEWKGNVRELLHVVERLVVTSADDLIDVGLLPKNLFGIIDETLPVWDNSDTGRGYNAMMEKYEGECIREAYKKYGSSRKLAGYLNISQTKANNLIRKYVDGV